MKRREHGYLILETGVYIFVLLILMGVAYMAMYRCIDRSLALHKNADALISALHAGEHWRADVRAATGPIRTQAESSQLLIPTGHGEILYRFETNTMLRRTGSNSWYALLPNVRSSQMQSDPRERTAAWRWELELLPVKKDGSNTNRIRPLFTFIAVPGAATNK